MNVLTWVLAVLFLASGVVKLVLPKQKLIASGLRWAEGFGDGLIKAIGALEILAALGLVLPGLLGVAPVVVILAAAGLVSLMAAAIFVHVRRREPQGIAVSVVLLALSAFVGSMS